MTTPEIFTLYLLLEYQYFVTDTNVNDTLDDNPEAVVPASLE